MKIQTITFNIPAEPPVTPGGFALYNYRVDRDDYELRHLFSAGREWAHRGIDNSVLIARA